MASSLEVRVPFTDHRLVQYVFALPKSNNYNNGVEKFILRKAMEREALFPKEILDREKVKRNCKSCEKSHHFMLD